jgi:hypothetical protein
MYGALSAMCWYQINTQTNEKFAKKNHHKTVGKTALKWHTQTCPPKLNLPQNFTRSCIVDLGFTPPPNGSPNKSFCPHWVPSSVLSVILISLVSHTGLVQVPHRALATAQGPRLQLAIVGVPNVVNGDHDLRKPMRTMGQCNGITISPSRTPIFFFIDIQQLEEMLHFCNSYRQMIKTAIPNFLQKIPRRRHEL